MKQITTLNFGLLFALVLMAGCGVKKSDTYKSNNDEIAHIYFGKNNVKLDKNDKEALDDLADIFKAEQSKTKAPLVIEVSGHTSKEGSLAANKKVAAKRAHAVAEYLRTKHNIAVVIHALEDPRYGEGASSRLVTAKILLKSESCEHSSPAKHHHHGHKAHKKAAPVTAPVVVKAAPAPVVVVPAVAAAAGA